MTFGLNMYFTGSDVFYFKLTNLVIHLLNGIGLYFLSWHLLVRLRSTYTLPDSDTRLRWLSLAIAAIWLLHPLNLTSVLYVVQRMASLASLFMILALLGYTLGREQLIRGKRRGFATIILSLAVFGALSILSKEIGILLLPLALITEVIFYRFNVPDSLKMEGRWFFICLFLVPLSLAAAAIVFKPGLLALDGYQYRNFTLTERLLTEARALWFYLRLITLPNINEMGTYHDDYALSKGLWDPPATLFSVLGLVLLIAMAIALYRRLPLITFAILWFLVGHSLESSIVPLEIMHEHRNYLPLYGILFSLVYYVSHPTKITPKTLKLRYGFLLVYALLLGTATYARANQWKGEWSLFNADATNHPHSASAHTSLAVLYNDNAMHKEAREHLEKAAELSPQSVETMIRLAHHHSLADGSVPPSLLDALEQRTQKYAYSNITIWLFEHFIAQAQRQDRVLHCRLMKIYENLINRPDIKLRPDWAQSAYNTLGINYYNLGNKQKALHYYELANGLKPAAFYYVQSAIIYATLGETSKAKQTIASLDETKLPLSERDSQNLEQLRLYFENPSAALAIK